MLSEQRKKQLQPLIDYILNKKSKKERVNLIYICVQNSRRSHLAQVIAQDTAFKYKIEDVHCYSGGIEVTRIHPNTLKVLEKMGYKFVLKEDSQNPVFELYYNKAESPILLYSKTFESIIPSIHSFAAVMVCSETETNCPYVPGAEKKFLIPYEDPKLADNSENPLESYWQIAQQIKEEMEFVFSKVKKGVGIR